MITLLNIVPDTDCFSEEAESILLLRISGQLAELKSIFHMLNDAKPSHTFFTLSLLSFIAGCSAQNYAFLEEGDVPD